MFLDQLYSHVHYNIKKTSHELWLIQIHKSIIIYTKKTQQNAFLPYDFHNFH
jgi:hypothetical protein